MKANDEPNATRLCEILTQRRVRSSRCNCSSNQGIGNMTADTKANQRTDAALHPKGIEGYSTQPASICLFRRAGHQGLVFVHTVSNGQSQAGRTSQARPALNPV